MKQVMQNLVDGSTEVIEAPAPKLRAKHLLIDTTASLISIGTERMLVDFGKAGLLAKARQQPEKVRQVLEKVRTDGLMTTVDAVRSKLAQPLPLGYSNVGVVRESGSALFAPGDRVVSNGPHADVVSVPQNLCARIPAEVDDQSALFTVVGSIALQGIRLAVPTLGESFVVTGVGLIGLLAVQILRANGCRVLAIDFDEAKLDLARSFGAMTCNPGAGGDPVAAASAFSRGQGVDGAIITASTKSAEPISQAARMCRKRGRIILVGVTGLELNRSEFYEKELSFQVSCSYGPGRYDPAYEEEGGDYPVGFVRWTEQRNFEAVLDLMASGAIDTSRLVSHHFAFEDAQSAYRVVVEEPSALGIVLDYGHPVESRHLTRVAIPSSTARPRAGASRPVLGVIGAGNYASRVLVPAFSKAGATLKSICSAGGSSALVQGRRAGFAEATSDIDAMLADPQIDAVAIVTRHDSHARLTIAALTAGKHVFVEKPLALTPDELAGIRAAHLESGRQLMVGYNRRFAPHVRTMKALIERIAEPKSFVMVMNAGALPARHWTHDPLQGGGRIVGEACHHIDLMRHLAGAPITSVQARRIGRNAAGVSGDDNAVIVLGFADGSFGTVHYLANGSAAFPKERIEVFAAGRTLQLDNFMRLRGFGWSGLSGRRAWRQDKGQDACAKAFVDAIHHGLPAPIDPDELFEVALATLDAAALLAAQN